MKNNFVIDNETAIENLKKIENFLNSKKISFIIF